MRLLLLLFLCLPRMAAAQFTDDFETGNVDDWTQTPDGRWDASTVNALSGNYALKHVFNNTVAATDVVCRPLGGLQVSRGTAAWRFLLRHGYGPSASNRWAVFLFSNAAGDEWKSAGTYEGYALGVNMAAPTGSDTLTLYAVRNHTFSVIRKTTVNWQEDVKTTGVGAIEVVGGA